MKLLRNILSGWAYMIVSSAVVLFMTPFIIKSLGVATFGVWALLLNVIGYLNLLDFGSQQAQARFLSRAVGKEDSTLFAEVFSNTAILFFAIGSLILIAVAILAQFGDQIFNIPAEGQDDFRLILWIIGSMVALEFASKSYGGSLAARESLDVINLIEICGVVVQALLVFSVLKYKLGLIGMASAVGLTMLLKIISYVVVAHVSIPHARISFKRYRLHILRELLGYGSVSYAIVALDLIKTNIGIPLIAMFMTTADAAYYSIAAQFVFYFYLMSRSVNGAFIPRISKLEGQGNWIELRHQFFLGTRIIAGMIFFVGISMMVFAGKFVELWLGKGFEPTYYVLLILTPAAMIALVQAVGTGFLFATSNHSFFAKISAAESVSAILLGLFLVKPLGVYGMAFGTLVPAIIFRGILLPRTISRLVGISLVEYFNKGFRAQIVYGAVYAVIAWSGYQLLKDEIASLWSFGVVAFMFLLVGLALAYAICLNADERASFVRRISDRVLRRQQSTS